MGKRIKYCKSILSIFWGTILSDNIPDRTIITHMKGFTDKESEEFYDKLMNLSVKTTHKASLSRLREQKIKLNFEKVKNTRKYF